MIKPLLPILLSMSLSSYVFGDERLSVKSIDGRIANLSSVFPTHDLLVSPQQSDAILRRPGAMIRYGTGLDSKRLEGVEIESKGTFRLNRLLDFQSVSQKAGPGVGGGGDIVKRPDGKIEIADAFEELAVFHDSSRPISLREDASFKELRRLEGQLNAIDLVPGFSSPKVLDESIHYLFVDSIPNDLEICRHGMSYKMDTSDGSQIIRAACTDINDKNTYLVENFFRKLSPSEQLILLYHEDMRRYGVSNGLTAIISRSLRTLIPILEEQMQGRIRALTAQELSLTKELFNSLARVGLFDTAIFGDKKFSMDQFSKKYRMTEYGGWIQSNVTLTLEQKVGLFATYWQTSDKDPLPTRFSLVATDVCNFKHQCELKEGEAIVGNTVWSGVIIEGQSKVPVTTFFSTNWGKVPTGTKTLRLDLTISGSLIANSGFVIFKKSQASSQWEIAAKGELEKVKTNPTVLSTAIPFEPGFQYVIRFQGQAHRPSVVVPGIVLQSLSLQMKLFGDRGEKILDSSQIKVVTDPRDPEGLLSPLTAINGQVYVQ